MIQAADAVQKKLEQGQSTSAIDKNGGKTEASPAKTTATPAKTSSSPAKTTATPAKTTATPSKTTATPAKTSTTPAKTTSSPAKTATAAPDKNGAYVYSLNKRKFEAGAGSDGATGAKKKNFELTYKYVSNFFSSQF